MKRILIIIILYLLSVFPSVAQIEQPVKWSYAFKRNSRKTGVLFIKAVIEQGWHIYSVNQIEGGPEKTSFKFKPSTEYTLLGKLEEPLPEIRFDKSFGIEIRYFESSVTFQQKIQINKIKANIKGVCGYMACTNLKCLPLRTVEFNLPIK